MRVQLTRPGHPRPRAARGPGVPGDQATAVAGQGGSGPPRRGSACKAAPSAAPGATHDNPPRRGPPRPPALDDVSPLGVDDTLDLVSFTLAADRGAGHRRPALLWSGRLAGRAAGRPELLSLPVGAGARDHAGHVRRLPRSSGWIAGRGAHRPPARRERRDPRRRLVSRVGRPGRRRLRPAPLRRPGAGDPGLRARRAGLPRPTASLDLDRPPGRSEVEARRGSPRNLPGPVSTPGRARPASLGKSGHGRPGHRASGPRRCARRSPSTTGATTSSTTR